MSLGGGKLLKKIREPGVNNEYHPLPKCRTETHCSIVVLLLVLGPERLGSKPLSSPESSLDDLGPVILR